MNSSHSDLDIPLVATASTKRNNCVQITAHMGRVLYYLWQSGQVSGSTSLLLECILPQLRAAINPFTSLHSLSPVITVSSKSTSLDGKVLNLEQHCARELSFELFCLPSPPEVKAYPIIAISIPPTLPSGILLLTQAEEFVPLQTGPVRKYDQLDPIVDIEF